MSLLDPTLDLVFKLLLTRKPALLRDMLEAILGKTIRTLTVLNPGIPGELSRDKAIILDIRALLDDGSRVDLEMQIRVTAILPARLVYYGARDYADQLARGNDYDRLTPTTVIVWLVEPMVPPLDRLHSIFELRERHTHRLFSDQLSIHVLQLSALPPSSTTGYDDGVLRWARFFCARDLAALDQLASEDPIMSLAKQTLEELSQDPSTHRLARERADALKLYELELAATRHEGHKEGHSEGRKEGHSEGRKEGHSEGRKEGRAELLLELLATRFGPPSAEVRARIEAATIAQLDAWAKRVLTAATLADVLAPW